MVYSAIHLVDFYGTCRYIYHTWIPWVMRNMFGSQLVMEGCCRTWMLNMPMGRLTHDSSDLESPAKNLFKAV